MSVIGERHWNARLTAEKVSAIRSSTLSTYRLAKDYGVSRRQVDRIRERYAWKHL